MSMKINLVRMSERTGAVLTPEEVQAVECALKIAEQVGYGNLMSWLATAWSKKMPLPAEPMQVTPYPLDWLDIAQPSELKCVVCGRPAAPRSTHCARH